MRATIAETVLPRRFAFALAEAFQRRQKNRPSEEAVEMCRHARSTEPSHARTYYALPYVLVQADVSAECRRAYSRNSINAQSHFPTLA
ncbi:hypothetical protein L1N85_18370 [Paenibacillus alkaliterrae]|uniref:hypothetical protein n=1 Tax=Paenibacillus alkaliterrae TaxID=320909 RepID=UPI001F3CC93E|nr:hypothetical protein [Paenibacillus alkaliterrae]MCF2940369.1 hypothetical protein [Paenibacillus alkaliterrae]